MKKATETSSVTWGVTNSVGETTTQDGSQRSTLPDNILQLIDTNATLQYNTNTIKPSNIDKTLLGS